MKRQALFSSKDKSKKIKVSSAAISLGSLRVKITAQPELKLAMRIEETRQVEDKENLTFSKLS